MTHRCSVLAVLLISVLLCGAAPGLAAADQHRSPEQCAAELTCGAEELNLMTMPERLVFLRAMSAGHASTIAPGHRPRWRNIEGIITFFHDHGLGAPGSWVSYVDAGILEGIERGIAIALGRPADTFGNPGSLRWATYLTELGRGRLADRSVHDRTWSEAEQASTEHGVALAEREHGVPASGVEQRFFGFSELYRWTLRNRPALLDPVSPGPRPGEQQRQLTLLDWFTDVSNPTPSRRGAELAYDMAEFDPAGGFLSGAALLSAYLTELADDYRAETTVR
ncbi:hypothetical protein [Amycolatopsis anabasis]|uniref:hypothetical protein n=1 Tax=Amycolatopsis anabasis TaxID=1840409 RepID=UPI00131A9DAF|nr:hypothetical protein [Amycolatopsis anabasis]